MREMGKEEEKKKRSSQHITPPVVAVVWLSDLLTISGCDPSVQTREWNSRNEAEGGNKAGQYE